MQKIPEKFTHLEVHSHYTLLGGTASVKDLVKRAVDENFTALALTDTNALYGIMQFSKLCKEANIKPVIGMVVNVPAPSGVMPPDNARTGRLVLLANGVQGYRSLCRLSSFMQVDRRRDGLDRAGLDWQILKNNHQGLICLSGGRLGWIDRLLRMGQPKQAARFAAQLGGLFAERCYLSISPQAGADPVRKEIVGLGERFGLPPAAVQPVFCLHAEEVPRMRLLAAIDHNCCLEDVDVSLLPDRGDPAVSVHWLNKEEIAHGYAEIPEALTFAAEIVDRCEPGLPDGRPIWPVLKFPKEQTPEKALEEMVRAGMREKYDQDLDGSIERR